MKPSEGPLLPATVSQMNDPTLNCAARSNYAAAGPAVSVDQFSVC